jgi:putative acetyltransferase
MTHKIRHARASDHPAIAEIIERAFTEEFGQSNEAALVRRLRDDGDVLFELVAEAEDSLVGHILFSRLWAGNGHLYAALAPMAVRPGLQKAGLGSSLVNAGLSHLGELGVRGVLVLGHPKYYPRFGFTAEAAAQVRSPYSGSPSFMALALEADAFDEAFTVAYPAAFSA